MPNAIDINARKIDLSNQGLKEIPSDIFRCKRLRKLILRGNSITSIPKEIDQLKGLTLLDLADNKIKNFHAPICKLQNLKILILNRNNISRLPKQVQFLSNLKILGLANNKLKALSEEMIRMASLEELNISGNIFSRFPCFLHQIKTLKKLWIRNYNKYSDEEIYSIGNFSSKCKIYEDCNIIFDAQESVRVSNSERITPNKIKKEPKVIENKTQMVNQDKPKDKLPKVETVEKTSIFISYSHKDDYWLNDVLMPHLKSLENITGNSIDVWSDEEIKSGQSITKEIELALNKAKVAILLFSPNYLSSNFITRKEIPPLMIKAKEEGTILKSIVVSDCMYTDLPYFSDIKAVNDVNEPLDDIQPGKRNRLLANMTRELKDELGLKVKSF